MTKNEIIRMYDDYCLVHSNLTAMYHEARSTYDIIINKYQIVGECFVNDPAHKQDLKKLVALREDIFTSDMEIAALGMAFYASIKHTVAINCD